MTFFSGTVTEVMYNMPAPGATYDASTSANVVLSGNTATNPPFQIPTPLWQPSYGAARLFKVVARGVWSSTTSTPTLAMFLSLNTTQGTYLNTGCLALTGSYAQANSVTNGTFTMDVDVTVNTVGYSGGNRYSCYANGTIFYGVGQSGLTTGGSSTAGFVVGMGGASTGGPPVGPTAFNFNPYTVQWLELSATWGANSSSNSITCTQFTVYGCN